MTCPSCAPSWSSWALPSNIYQCQNGASLLLRTHTSTPPPRRLEYLYDYHWAMYVQAELAEEEQTRSKPKGKAKEGKSKQCVYIVAIL